MVSPIEWIYHQISDYISRMMYYGGNRLLPLHVLVRQGFVTWILSYSPSIIAWWKHTQNLIMFIKMFDFFYMTNGIKPPYRLTESVNVFMFQCCGWIKPNCNIESRWCGYLSCSSLQTKLHLLVLLVINLKKCHLVTSGLQGICNTC